MIIHLRFALGSALVAVTVACSDATRPSPTPAQPSQPVVAGFQPLTKPGTIYLAPDSVYRQSQGYGDLASRFVLFDDGTFVLEFAGMGTYAGRYTRADSVITFDWDGWSTAGRWGATGVVRGDDLTVRYNDIMLLTDFMDGTYRHVK